MFEKNVQKMKDNLLYIQALGDIYTLLENEMKWNCMKYHEADDSHDTYWYTEFDEGEYTDYMKVQRKAYNKVLYCIEELVGNI